MTDVHLSEFYALLNEMAGIVSRGRTLISNFQSNLNKHLNVEADGGRGRSPPDCTHRRHPQEEGNIHVRDSAATLSVAMEAQRALRSIEEGMFHNYHHATPNSRLIESEAITSCSPARNSDSSPHRALTAHDVENIVHRVLLQQQQQQRELRSTPPQRTPSPTSRPTWCGSGSKPPMARTTSSARHRDCAVVGVPQQQRRQSHDYLRAASSCFGRTVPSPRHGGAQTRSTSRGPGTPLSGRGLRSPRIIHMCSEGTQTDKHNPYRDEHINEYAQMQQLDSIRVLLSQLTAATSSPSAPPIHPSPEKEIPATPSTPQKLSNTMDAAMHHRAPKVVAGPTPKAATASSSLPVPPLPTAVNPSTSSKLSAARPTPISTVPKSTDHDQNKAAITPQAAGNGHTESTPPAETIKGETSAAPTAAPDPPRRLEAPNSDDAIDAEVARLLSEGVWVEKVDPKKNKPYYVNKKEKRTVWSLRKEVAAQLNVD
eukprot:PhM_4_TR3432/c0_g1_i1/m.50309